MSPEGSDLIFDHRHNAADRVERRGPGGALAMPCAYRAELTQLGMAQATTAVTRSAWTRASQT
jgi:hypothetical protein